MRPVIRSGKRLIPLFLLVFSACIVAQPLTALGEETQSGAKKVMLRESSYYYSAFNKRDPFSSLIVGDFVKNKKMDPVDLNSVELVGVVKGDLDRFSLLEDENGFSYILRVGDQVKNGSVVAIGDKSLVARVTNFGQTTKFTLHMSQRAEGDRK
jgi:Tfp pilus assembly protein PilP